MGYSLVGPRRPAGGGAGPPSRRQVVLDGLRLGLLAVGTPRPRRGALLYFPLDVAGT